MNTLAAYISQATLMNDMDPCAFDRINWAAFVTGPGTTRDDLISVYSGLERHHGTPVQWRRLKT